MKSSGQLKQVIWLVGTYVYQQQLDHFVRHASLMDTVIGWFKE